MARFDVHRLPGTDYLAVDVQADILRSLRTRMVIPLVPDEHMADEAAPRLRPRLSFDGRNYILNTPEMAALPCSALGECAGSLAPQDNTIVDAIDFLLQGF